MIVYKATNTLNGKVYIGQTSQSLKRRISAHKTQTLAGRYNGKFAKAIREYGVDSFEWKIIDTGKTQEELFEKEIYWINFYNSYKNGYNMTIGGDGATGNIPSKETRKKMSESRKGIHAGEKHPMYGKRHTEESREKMSTALKKVFTEEKIEKDLLKNGNKPFLVFDTKGNLLGEYINKKACSRELGINNARLGIVLKEGSYFFQNVIVMYKEQYTEEVLREKVSERSKWNINKVTRGPKLTEKDVMQIKRLIQEKTLSDVEIGKMFNVSGSNIYLIRKGKAWTHVN